LKISRCKSSVVGIESRELETKTPSLSPIGHRLPSGFFQSQSRKRCLHRPLLAADLFDEAY
jgi:hypothetical protein